MKKHTILLTIGLLLTIFAQAQEIEDKTFINFSGSYIENGDAYGGNLSLHSKQNKNLNLDFNFGRFVNDKFAIGVGFEYGFLDQQSYSKLDVINDFFLTENYIIKSNVFAPYILLKYRKSLSKKLNFDLNLTTQYGFLKADNNYNQYKFYYTDSDVYDITEIPDNIAIFRNTEANSQFLNISLEPELNYFITDKFGLLLKLGGINYTNIEFNNSIWNVDFKPSTWQYGITFRF